MLQEELLDDRTEFEREVAYFFKGYEFEKRKPTQLERALFTQWRAAGLDTMHGLMRKRFTENRGVPLTGDQEADLLFLAERLETLTSASRSTSATQHAPRS